MIRTAGFTLIEMSIVLVIIGLIVGGILVGQDLIRSAEIRATISQIEKYQTAVNTFRGKYGYLPGDINAQAAAQFGFAARGTYPGQGDGNGILEASYGCPGSCISLGEGTAGEMGMFWVDLSHIGLIDASINPSAYASGGAWNGSSQSPVSGAQISQYLPAAKIGQGNSIYVWSGGAILIAYQQPQYSNFTNYFTIGANISFQTDQGPHMDMGLTVKQAYDIDKKIDDGMPQSGRVTTMFLSQSGVVWAAGQAGDSVGGLLPGLGDDGGGPVVNPANEWGGDSASTTTCYDWISPSNLPVTYSIGGNASPNNSNRVNCTLSFQFQ